MFEEPKDIGALQASPMVRRAFLTAMGMAITLPLATRMARAEEALAGPIALPMPLKTITHHIGISVRDVVKSATFYSRLFGGDNVDGEKSPSLRYFINLNSGSGVSGSTSAGSVAIGLLGTAGGAGHTIPFIDHMCFDAKPFDNARWQARLKQEGMKAFASIFFGVDGIPFQMSGGEGVQMSEGEIEKVPTLYTGKALVTSHGFDYVMIRVSDIDIAAAFFDKFFALKGAMKDGVMWLGDGKSRLGLRKVAAGETPGFDEYVVKVDPFDRRKLSEELRKIGATIHEDKGPSNRTLHFADVDAIKVGLTAI